MDIELADIEHAICGINYSGSASGAPAPSSGLFSQTSMKSNVGISGFGVPQGQSTSHMHTGKNRK